MSNIQTVRLSTHQVAEFWDVIRGVIVESIPPITYASDEKLSKLLQALLEERMQCWMTSEITELSEEEDHLKTYCILITTIQEEVCSEARNLLIYCAYAFKQTTEQIRIDIFNVIKEFAQRSRCHRIVGYSNQHSFIELVKSLPGGHADYVFLTVDV